jgi:tetratricopeptide (TPR) repeat protein
MLFDIRGKRKRFIQVIYVFLALLLGGGLVLFGIGGDATGGLGDAIGIGQGSNSSGSPEYDEEIDQAEATLAEDPDNAQALLSLSRYNFLNAEIALQDEQTDEALSRFEDSVDAWERYLKAEDGTPDSSGATFAFRAYTTIAGTSDNVATIERRLKGAQRAAEIVAEDLPGPTSYLDLAAISYALGDTKTGDEAAKQALKIVDDAGRSALETQLKQVKRQGNATQKQLEAMSDQQADPGALENPLDALGGASGGTTPPTDSGG